MPLTSDASCSSTTSRRSSGGGWRRFCRRIVRQFPIVLSCNLWMWDDSQESVKNKTVVDLFNDIFVDIFVDVFVDVLFDSFQ
jgi:hypothetical protein